MSEPDFSAFTCGQLGERSSPADLASSLAACGINVDHNRFCVRVLDCSHFKFVFADGSADLDADADNTKQMLADASLVSEALAIAKIRHCFEVYDHSDALVEYFHYDWPQTIEPQLIQSRARDNKMIDPKSLCCGS